MSWPWFLAFIAAGALLSAAGDRFARNRRVFAWWWYGCWTAGFTAMSALSAATGAVGWAVWLGVSAALQGFEWWRHCKRADP